MQTDRIPHVRALVFSVTLAWTGGLIFTGYNANSSRLDRLAPGMNMLEVRAALGRPHATRGGGRTEFLTYSLLDQTKGDRRAYTVALVDGRVESFGEQGDSEPNRWAATTPTPMKQ